MDGSRDYSDILNEASDVFGVPKVKTPKTSTTRTNPYRSLIEESAARHGIDPDLIDAQMSQESGFRPNAKSNKNAEGLMQMIPATAARFGVSDVYDPKQNIEGGVKYMRWLLDKFDGDVDLALAGYNAGEGAVMKYGNKIPPYRETQDYVKKIRSNYKGGGRNQFSGAPDYAAAPDYSDLLNEASNVFGASDNNDLLKEVNDVFNPLPVGTGANVTTDLATGEIIPKVGILPSAATPPVIPKLGVPVNPTNPVNALPVQSPPDIAAPVSDIPDYADLLKEAGDVFGANLTKDEESEIAGLPTAQIGQTTFGANYPAQTAAPSLPADYQEYLKARELPDSIELRNEYSAAMQSAPSAYQPTAEQNEASTQNAAANAKYQRELAAYNAKYKTGGQSTASPTLTQAAPTTMKTDTSDNIAESENSGNRISLDLSNVTGDKNDYINQTAAKEIAAKYDVPEADALEILGKYPQMHGDGTPFTAEEQQAQQTANIRLTPELIAEIRQKSEAKPTYTPPTVDPDAARDEELRAQAYDNIVNSPFTLGTDAEIEEEYQTLKRNRLSAEDERKAANVGGNLNDYLGENLGGLVGGAIGSGGRVYKSLAGIARPFAGFGIAGEALHREFSKIAQYSDIAEANSGGDGTVSKVLKIGGALPADLSRLAVLSRIPGGSSGMIVGFAADNALQSAGAGESVDKVIKSGIKGAALGATFGIAGKVGGAAENVFRKNAINFVDAFPSNAAYKTVNAAANIVREGYEIGTIAGGTMAIEKVAGSSDHKAAHSAIFNALFHVVGKVQGKAFDKIYKIWQDGKASNVYVDPQGKVRLLTGEVEPNYVDAEIITDPNSQAYKASENARRIGQGTPETDFDAKVNQENAKGSLTPQSKLETSAPPRELSEQVPLRAESADPTLTQKIAVDSRAQKIIEQIKDGKSVTVEQIQKTTRINQKNVEETLMNLYGARQIEINADNSIRFIGNESANQNLGLYERIKQQNEKIQTEIQQKPSPVEKSEDVSNAEVLPSENLVTKDISSPDEKVDNLSIYEALPQQKQQEAKTEQPKARLDYAERPNIAEKLNVFTERGTKAQIEPKVVEQSDLLTSLDAGYPPEFQPRDRSRAASKAQISEIAGKLNPEFLGDSPKASDGRPLTVPVSMSDGTTKYAVISGNGRTQGIREAYNLNNDGAQAYKSFASSKGGENLSQPVYIGVMNPNEIDDFSNFAKEANESATALMSVSEQAKSDADRLDSSVLNLFVPSEDGTIHGAANRDFVRAFLDKTTSTGERNRYIDADGKLNQEGVTKVKNAIFAKAFGGSEMGTATLQRMAESTDSNIKNITNALLAKAGELSSFASAAKDNRLFADADIAPDFARAMEKYSELKESNTPLDEYIRQGALFGADTSPLQTRVMQVFDHYKRRSKSIKGIIDNYIKAAEALGDPNQRGLFGTNEIPSKESIFEAAVRDYEQRDTGENENEAVRLFDQNQGRANQSEARISSDGVAVENGQAQNRETKGFGGNRLDAPLYSRAAPSQTLLAPNGKPSNLTPFQHQQVRTEAFKKWFGDWEHDPANASKVVDENGEPLVVYRGQSLDLGDEFRYLDKNLMPAKSDPQTFGFFFTDSAEEASYYAKDEGNVTPLFLNIKKPLDLLPLGTDSSEKEFYGYIGQQGVTTYKSRYKNDYASVWSRFDAGGAELQYDIRQAKRDGVIYNDDGQVRSSFITFNSNQIKSAIGNNGEYSSENDSILYRKPTPADRIEERKAQVLTRDLDRAIKQDVTITTLRDARISPDGKLNEAATAIITHAKQGVIGNAPTTAWHGVFLNPTTTQAVRASLENLLNSGTSPAAKIFGKRILSQFDAATKENGSITLITSSINAPSGLKSARQEEAAHEFDYFEGKNHDVSVRTIFNDSTGNEAMRNLSAEGSAYRGSSPVTLAKEVAAKVWVDGNNELGLSSEQIEGLQDAVYDAWSANGTSENEIIDFIRNLSDRGKAYAERRTNQSGFAGNSRNRGEIDTRRTRTDDSQDSASGRTETELRRPADARSGLLRQPIAAAERPQNGQNQNLEQYQSPQQTALINRDTAFAERRFRNQPDLAAIAKTEILYARASVAPKTKIGGGLMKVGRGALDVVSAPKSLMSSLDISAPGRQGLILTLANPKEAKIAFVQQIKSFKKDNFDTFVRDLNLHPFIDDAETGGLYLSTLADQSQLGQREESFMSRLVGDDDLFTNKAGEKIRRILTFHVRASERAYVSYLDSIRIGTFAKLTKAADAFNARNNFAPDEVIDTENNITRREDQLSAIAQFVNYATGRGTLGKFEDAAPILNGLFFSPRFLMSRLQLLNPKFYAKLPPGVRSSIIKQMLIYAGGTAFALGLMKLMGGDIELGEIDNPDFLLKVSFGAYHYDFGGGMVQPIRFISRMVSAAYQRASGNPQKSFNSTADAKIAKEMDLGIDFIRSKTSPTIGSAWNMITGSNLIGEPTSLQGEAFNLASPMIVGDVQKTVEADGSLGAVKLLPSLIGIGVSRYEKKDKAKPAVSGDTPAPPADPKTRQIQIDTYRKMLDSTNAKVREIGEKRLKELEPDAPIRPFADFRDLRQSENVEDDRDMDAEKSRANLARWKDQRQSDNVIDLRKDRPLTNYLKAVKEDDIEGMKRWNREVKDLTPAEEQEMFKALRAHFKRIRKR